MNREEEISLEYEIKVSVWNSVSSRLSRDAQISPDQSRTCVAFFEIPFNEIESDTQTYCFIDLIHRYTYHFLLPIIVVFYLYKHFIMIIVGTLEYQWEVDLLFLT